MTAFTKTGLADRILRAGLDVRTAKVVRDVADSAGTAPLASTMTASGVVPEGTTILDLDHTSVAIAATMDVSTVQGLFIVKAPTEPGVAADHTLTVSGGTLDGTNTIATFADINDALVIYFDGAGTGYIVVNTGAVVLS